MNFKIENNYLDITNYPSVERHLEKMASQGWLIDRIINGNLFIYKKIKPEMLDFSITPYEVETAFTKKSKEELEEFNSVCESVGWNYATKSYDLHIYFKEQGSEAMDIQTDEEEEFKTIEFIGKKYLKSYYIQIPMLLFFSWFMLGMVYSNIHSMKSGLTQIAVPLIPVEILLSIVNLIHIRRFLKKNRKNMEEGKDIEFSESQFYFNRVSFSLISVTLFILIIFAIFSSIFLRNRFMIIGFIPALIGLVIGFVYRVFIKPSKKSVKYKKIAFILTLVVAAFLSTAVLGGTIMGIINGENHRDRTNIDDYKVLSVNDFFDDALEEEGDLRRQVSILIPRSYEYYSYSRGHVSIITEYAKALTEDLGSNLVNRYIRQAENALTGRFSREIDLYLEEGIFDDYLLKSGLTEKDLKALEDKDTKEIEEAARNIVYERSIIEIVNLWDADEAYYLNYEKTELVIRNGKEVFYLDGLDFSDNEIIEIVKDRLGLN